MAKAKAREIREMAADAIATKVKEMEANLFDMRLQASLGKLENTALLNTTRKDIARAKTILKQKETTAK
ncbi:MAG: 50S ribosomal protein L29 [Fibrobacteres bacterium]|jgi:large subunit ribosomal protein L29|nr:50S ribosomal protein L29 [Fibrobacterota bacterium]